MMVMVWWVLVGRWASWVGGLACHGSCLKKKKQNHKQFISICITQQHTVFVSVTVHWLVAFINKDLWVVSQQAKCEWVCACVHARMDVHACVWQSGRVLTYVVPPGEAGRWGGGGGEDALTGRRLIAIILLPLRFLISVTILQHHNIVKTLSPTALCDGKLLTEVKWLWKTMSVARLI